MKAKCPYCDSGCKKCSEGFFEVGLATGLLYTIYCPACRETNGGRIVGEDLPPLPAHPHPRACVWCKHPETEWKLIGYLGE